MGKEEISTSYIFSENKRQRTFKNPKFYVLAKASKTSKICLESYSSIIGKIREGKGGLQRAVLSNDQEILTPRKENPFLGRQWHDKADL